MLWSHTSVDSEWVIDEAESRRREWLPDIGQDRRCRDAAGLQATAGRHADRLAGRRRGSGIPASDPPPPCPDSAHGRICAAAQNQRQGASQNQGTIRPRSHGSLVSSCATHQRNPRRSWRSCSWSTAFKPAWMRRSRRAVSASRRAIRLPTPSSGSSDISASNCTTRPVRSRITGIPPAYFVIFPVLCLYVAWALARKQ